MTGGIDHAYAGKLRHIGGSDICPAGSAISGNMNEPVVRTDPDGIYVVIGGSQGKHGGVDLRSVHVIGDNTAAHAQGRRIGERQIRAYFFPGLSLVAAQPYTLRSD